MSPVFPNATKDRMQYHATRKPHPSRFLSQLTASESRNSLLWNLCRPGSPITQGDCTYTKWIALPIFSMDKYTRLRLAGFYIGYLQIFKGKKKNACTSLSTWGVWEMMDMHLGPRICLAQRPGTAEVMLWLWEYFVWIAQACQRK